MPTDPTPERVREIAEWLDDLAKDAARGLASNDYYVGGMMDAPDPDDLREVAALVRQVIALREELAELRPLAALGQEATQLAVDSPSIEVAIARAITQRDALREIADEAVGRLTGCLCTLGFYRDGMSDEAVERLQSHLLPYQGEGSLRARLDALGGG